MGQWDSFQVPELPSHPRITSTTNFTGEMTMARKAPTEAQKRAAEQRREQFKALAKTVSAMDEDSRQLLAMECGIRTVEGRELSPFNQCLIHHQRPGCSVVGGFRQWLAAGRIVRKGETGLGLWVPVGSKAGDASNPDAKGESSEGDSAKSRGGSFIMGIVFDVSQTDAQAN